MRIETPSCDNCRFWKELNPGGEGRDSDGGYDVTEPGTGLCRRQPPVLGELPDGSNDAMDAANAARWPVTWDEDWCGEHRAKLRSV